MPPETAAVAAAIVFFGSVARGFTGFGAVLFTLPLLALLLQVKVAVPLLAVLGLANGVWLTWRCRAEIDRAESRRLLIGGIPGVLAGLLLFQRAADPVLRGWLGVVVVVVGAWLALRGVEAGRSWSSWWGTPAGVVGGVLGGLYGLSGPAPIFYLSGRPADAAVFRATLLFYITVLDVILAGGFTRTGALPASLWLLGLGLLPFAVVGSWCGERLQRRAPDATFRRLAGVGLAGMGLVLVATAVAGNR